MNNKTETEPLQDNLRDLIGQAISDEIAAGAEQPDWCDSREIDRLADAVLAVLPKRRTTLSPELRAALDEAVKTGATATEVPGGGVMFINRGEQLEEWADLNCPACGGSGHADDARAIAASPTGPVEAFAAFCDREGYPSDGDIDVALRKAFDEGLRLAVTAPAAEAPPALSDEQIRNAITASVGHLDRLEFIEAVAVARAIECIARSAVQPAAAPAVQVQENAIDAGGLGAAVMHAIYRAYQRGDSPERTQAAVMSCIALAAPSTAQAQPVAVAEPSAREQKLAERVGWTTKQWYEHVGARENGQDEIVFGTVMALRAMMVQFREVTLYAAGKRAAQSNLDAATAELKPFMYAIMEPSGAPYMDEFCVASNAGDLHSTLNGLNDSPDTGYNIVPVYTAPSAPPTAMQERAWFKEWLANREDKVSVDAVEFGRLAWAERARRAVKGAA